MEKLVFQVNLQLLNDWGLIKRHPLHDVAVLSIAKLGKMGTNGRLQTELSLAVTNCSPTIRNWAGWPTDACVLFGGIDDASDAYILGYPVELLNDRLPLEVDFTSPLVRKGVISQRNQRTGKLIIDSGVYGGNSGGPILITSHPAPGVTSFKIGGLITQFVPVETRVFPQIGVTNSVLVNSGYGVAEPMDYALELIGQF